MLPEVLDTYLGVRERELALVAVAFDAAGPRELEAQSARAGIDAVKSLLERLGQRRTLSAQGLAPDSHDTIAEDAVDDVAIDNSPRIPSKAEVLRILGRVA